MSFKRHHITFVFVDICILVSMQTRKREKMEVCLVCWWPTHIMYPDKWSYMTRTHLCLPRIYWDPLEVLSKTSPGVKAVEDLIVSASDAVSNIQLDIRITYCWMECQGKWSGLIAEQGLCTICKVVTVGVCYRYHCKAFRRPPSWSPDTRCCNEASLNSTISVLVELEPNISPLYTESQDGKWWP